MLLLEVAITTRGKIILIGSHLRFVDQKLSAELINLRLQRSNTGLKVRKLDFRFLARRFSFRRIIRNDFLEFQPVDRLVM